MKTNNKNSQEKKKNSYSVKSEFMTDKLRNNLIILLICTFTIFVFSDVVNCKFVLWDDDFYIQRNDLIKDLSLQGLKNIFTTPVLGMYNPLVFFIYALEYKVWGLNPQIFHIFNLLFHLLATITVYKFIFKLIKRYETATIVALLFAIHPMHVGAVAWASQLKTALFLIFYFLSLSQYLNYIRNNYAPKYLIYTGLLFVLSALSKPSAVTLAPMLFLIDYYVSRKRNMRMFLEKIPFFVIALFFGILTMYTHSEADDTIFESELNYSLINNILVSNYSIAFYLIKLIVPLNLSTIYPYPDNDTFLPMQYYFSILVIPLIILLIYKAGKFRKELIFGLLFFAIAISVLLRITPSGFFMTANRYTYLSYTGFFFIIGQYFTYVFDNQFTYSRKIKNYLLAFLCIFVIFCSYRTTVRVKVWENSITLYNDILLKNPKVPIAYYNRAIAKQDIGDFAGAKADLEKAIELKPDAPAYTNLGEIKRALNDEDGAFNDYSKAISIDTKYSNAYNNRALIFRHREKYNEAMQDFNNAIQFLPDFGVAYHNRASLKIALGDTIGALNDWKKAASLGLEESGKFYNMYVSSKGK